MAVLSVRVLRSYYLVLPLSLLPDGLWRCLSHGAWPQRAPDAPAVLARMRSAFAALPAPALLVWPAFSPKAHDAANDEDMAALRVSICTPCVR